MSTVLYDCRMAEESILDDLSLMMKGESLPAKTHWQGIPAQPMRKTENPYS
jgi:carbonic anhydrase/acetyltransferase-like protein (isoleucine patch superfamily)